MLFLCRSHTEDSRTDRTRIAKKRKALIVCDCQTRVPHADFYGRIRSGSIILGMQTLALSQSVVSGTHTTWQTSFVVMRLYFPNRVTLSLIGPLANLRFAASDIRLMTDETRTPSWNHPTKDNIVSHPCEMSLLRS
jgi:hypothetical protein